MTKHTSKRPSLADQKALVLGVFIDAAEQGEDELARYLQHVGITPEDITEAGNAEKAILSHYRITAGYDVDAVAADLARYPPIAARIRELKREKRAQEASRAR